jgi:hypothetical protein
MIQVVIALTVTVMLFVTAWALQGCMATRCLAGVP